MSRLNPIKSSGKCEVELVNITREMAGNWSGLNFWAGEEEIWGEVVVVLDMKSVNISLSQKDLVEAEEMKDIFRHGHTRK